MGCAVANASEPNQPAPPQNRRATLREIENKEQTRFAGTQCNAGGGYSEPVFTGEPTAIIAPAQMPTSRGRSAC